MTKKRFAIVLILTMMLTSLPAFAFAGDDDAAVDDGTNTEVTAGEEGSDEEQSEEVSAPVNKVVTEDCVLVYYNGSGVKDMSAGWKKASNGTYYSNGSKIVTSPTKVKGSKKVSTNYLYMFGTDGKLITTKGLYKYNGKEYYGLGGGVLKTGWAAVGKKAMYFYPKNGSMAKDTKIGYLKVPKSGRLGEAYALGVKKLDSTKWTLKQAYKNSYKLKYKGRWYRAKNAETYALRGFKKGYGNCYVMASTFYIQAKLLGYDVHQVQGKVAYIWPHSWTVIKQKGKEWVYDPNFRNETGRSGWKIWYGKKGTWRYTNKKKMN